MVARVLGSDSRASYPRGDDSGSPSILLIFLTSVLAKNRSFYDQDSVVLATHTDNSNS